MRGPTHSLGGALAGAAFAYATSMPTTDAVAAIGLGALGGLLPDIDHAHSQISHEGGFNVIGAVVRLFFTHRGVLHTPLFWGILFGVLAYFFPQYRLLIIPLYLGVLSHLALDMLNPTGVPILWPFTSKKIHFAKIRTGSFAETAVRGALAIAMIAVIFHYQMA